MKEPRAEPSRRDRPHVDEARFEPVILGFLCNWCSYRGADLAGTSRMKYPPNLRAIRVPCSGRISPELVLRAFREGADGVLVLGCHFGDCHYQEGNYRMARRMAVLGRLIGYAGIESERLGWDYVSAAEGQRFARLVSEFTEGIRGLPPIATRLPSMDPASLAVLPSDGDGNASRIDVAAEGDHVVRAQDDPRWDSLRQAGAELLAEVEGIVALRHAHGDVAPHLYATEEELDDLAVWPKYPLPETVRLLQAVDSEARLGVVCRACEERGLVEMAKRGQVHWDRLTLIGLACSPDEVQACRCSQPAPSHAQVVVGEPSAPATADPVLEALPETAEERLAFWRYWTDRCIKCYACRDACPQCFCQACALEEDHWVERGRLPPPFPMFHLIKAVHMAGKCVACRECEMACPAEIPLTILYRMVNQDTEELFGYRPGSDLESVPPLLLSQEEGVGP